MSRTWPLRAGVLALLLAALYAGDGVRPTAGVPLVLRGWADGAARPEADRAVAAALTGTAPSVVVRRDRSPPAAAELEVLAALARVAPLVVALPAAGGVRVEAPERPRSERAAAIPFTGTAAAGDTLVARLYDGAGALDSMRLVASAAGRVEGAFRVRPGRDGWHAWEVEVAGVRGGTGAWVRAAAPPRVLIAAGAPTWESRFLLRALDEAGVATAAQLPLGRDLHAGDGGTALPVDPGALDAYDGVVVLPGAAVGPAERQALERFVAQGGGVLAVARPDLGAALGLGAPTDGTAEVAAGAVTWTLPAELVPLPAAELNSAVHRLAGGAGVWIAAHDGVAPVLTLRSHGHGRVAALGLLETWRWRMEGGLLDEHREFWRSLADWLAGEGRATPRLRLATGSGAVGVPAVIESWDGAAAAGDPATDPAAPGVWLERPDGSRDRLVAGLGDDGVRRVAFVPADTGVHRIGTGAGETVAGYRALDRGGRAADGTARLTLLAHRSGGAALPADSVQPWLDARAATLGEVPRGAWLRWLLFAALLGAVFAEWTIRRLGGAR